MDFIRIKGIKERSVRLENDAKKQNEYQERRLSKLIVGIKKEHEGNMSLLNAQERELEKKNDQLSDQLGHLEHYTCHDQSGSDSPESIRLELPSIAEQRRGTRLYGEPKKKALGQVSHPGAFLFKLFDSSSPTARSFDDGKDHKNPWFNGVGSRAGAVVVRLLSEGGSEREEGRSRRHVSTERINTAGVKLPPL